jgi:SHS2 domain-containing protein
MPYEELPHTADIRVRVTGATHREIFREAAQALMAVMYGLQSSQQTISPVRHEVHLTEEDTGLLLHSFLSEVIFLSETSGTVFTAFEVNVLEDQLDAVLLGVPFDPDVHGMGHEVKGVSLSGMRILNKEGQNVLEILFDI